MFLAANEDERSWRYEDHFYIRHGDAEFGDPTEISVISGGLSHVEVKA